MTRAAGILSLLLFAGHVFAQSSADTSAMEAYRRLFGKVDGVRLSSDIAAISKAPSRLAGSDGERQALEFVEKEFRRLGLTRIRHEPFSVTIPDPSARGVL